MTPRFVTEWEREEYEREKRKNREIAALRARIAELEAAITEFSKATSMKDGPSLAMQRHDPTWEAWKKLCQRLAS